VSLWTKLNVSDEGLVMLSCEHGNESSNSIKRWEFINQICNYQLLRKDSAPLS